ncbi:MAG: hypothetical protein V7L11_30565 [Nostoc sp.]|uniref:hypothetical protein n=1 Tax=Nostoc sp. TaxID=1180 RepID=UPI002FF8CB0F
MQIEKHYGGWGLGTGDWGLGIGDWGDGGVWKVGKQGWRRINNQYPMPNAQCPMPYFAVGLRANNISN